MQSIEEIEIEEMQRLEPDYHYYALLGKLTIVEFSLVIHRIDPELYSPVALDRSLMFFRGDKGLLLPDTYVPKKRFLLSLEKAYKTYNILDRVEWNIKYRHGSDYMALNHIPINWLISEAMEKNVNIPEEFLNSVPKPSIISEKIINSSEKYQIKSQSKFNTSEDADTEFCSPPERLNKEKIESNLTGQHHRAKREMVLKYAIAIVLNRRNKVAGAQAIVNAMHIKEKSIGDDSKLREINRYLKYPLDFSNRDSSSEQLHGIILHTAYQLMNKSVIEINSCIEKVMNESMEIAKKLGFSDLDGEIKRIIDDALNINKPS